ncbi:hypothetical protein NMY22_g17114 [Coprinellus aureogranulatus]|nr:hypothetical protein NMY22_g17114 [Coprinellus aureogranulatus]
MGNSPQNLTTALDKVCSAGLWRQEDPSVTASYQEAYTWRNGQSTIHKGNYEDTTHLKPRGNNAERRLLHTALESLTKACVSKAFRSQPLNLPVGMTSRVTCMRPRIQLGYNLPDLS